jgi:hypothetical protein
MAESLSRYQAPRTVARCWTRPAEDWASYFTAAAIAAAAPATAAMAATIIHGFSARAFRLATPAFASAKPTLSGSAISSSALVIEFRATVSPALSRRKVNR